MEELVKIKRLSGFIKIPLSRYDERKHELYEEPKPKPVRFGGAKKAPKLMEKKPEKKVEKQKLVEKKPEKGEKKPVKPKEKIKKWPYQ